MNTQIDQKYYTYVFVRKDITLQQQIVQASHAALQAGLKFTNPSNEPNSLIVIGIRNKEQLLKAMSFLEKNNITYESFSEPSWDYGLTAFASQPILETDRKVFKSFQLWRNS